MLFAYETFSHILVWVHFQGRVIKQFSFLSSHLIGGQLLRVRICSRGSKFFPLRVDRLLEGFRPSDKQTGSHLSCFPF